MQLGHDNLIQKYNGKALKDLHLKLQGRLDELETYENHVVFKGTIPVILI